MIFFLDTLNSLQIVYFITFIRSVFENLKKILSWNFNLSCTGVCATLLKSNIKFSWLYTDNSILSYITMTVIHSKSSNSNKFFEKVRKRSLTIFFQFPPETLVLIRAIIRATWGSQRPPGSPHRSTEFSWSFLASNN